MEGKVDDVEAYIQKNSTAAKAKKIMSVFVWDGHQIPEIDTNLPWGSTNSSRSDQTPLPVKSFSANVPRDDKSVSRSTKDVLGNWLIEIPRRLW